MAEPNLLADRAASRRFVPTRLRWLTNSASASKVVQGRASGPFLLSAFSWEVVQLAVHQILDLIILVRVQASQPILLNQLGLLPKSKS
jgi:hypothetical protein